MPQWSGVQACKVAVLDVDWFKAPSVQAVFRVCHLALTYIWSLPLFLHLFDVDGNLVVQQDFSSMKK